jgi:hypothetical protein
MKILLLLWALAVLPAYAQGVHSLRRCVLLPVTDSVGGVIAAKVFEQVERYLLEGTWCQYQSNSGLLSVFSRYRENLPQHLKTPEVIRTVAEKLKAGSIVRVTLVSEVNGLEVQLDVMDGGGDDLLHSERTVLNKSDVDLAAQTVRNWLEVYGRLIPYDGRVTGILGDQITLDVGRAHPVKVGQDFSIRRMTGVKRHPLLKKVVDWETQPLAEGKIFSVSDDQALGQVKVYRTDNKLKTGDWMRLEPLKDEMPADESRYPDKDPSSFGKLGLASVYLTAGTSTLGTSANGSKRLGGSMLGFHGRAEAWVTREWFGLLEFSRSLGTLKKKSGSLTSSTTDYSRGTFKLGGGWKYLPLGFFYGPQVDVYGGYASHMYKADYSSADGLGEWGVRGIFLGAGTNFPITRSYRGIVRAEFIPFPDFEDSDSVYGSDKSLSWMQLELGLRYQWSPNLMLDGLLEMTSAKASFGGTVRSVSAQDTAVKLGASFNF